MKICEICEEEFTSPYYRQVICNSADCQSKKGFYLMNKYKAKRKKKLAKYKKEIGSVSSCSIYNDDGTYS